MENFSENKRKRGRPHKLNCKGIPVKAFVKINELCNGKSERTQMNAFYALEAQIALDNGENPDFSYIISRNFEYMTWDVYKKTILIELGRLENDVLIKDAARVISENRLNTMEAVTYIKQFRTGRKQSGNCLDLTKAIAKTIDEYNLKHSAVNDEMIKDSLSFLLNVFSENISNNKEDTEK